MILNPKILKNVKDVEYMDDFDDWYIFKENSSDYAELPPPSDIQSREYY